MSLAHGEGVNPLSNLSSICPAEELGAGPHLPCFMGTGVQFLDLSWQQVILLPISSFLQGLMQWQLSPVYLPLTGQGLENRRGRSVGLLPL